MPLLKDHLIATLATNRSLLPLLNADITSLGTILRRVGFQKIVVSNALVAMSSKGETTMNLRLDCTGKTREFLKSLTALKEWSQKYQTRKSRPSSKKPRRKSKN